MVQFLSRVFIIRNQFHGQLRNPPLLRNRPTSASASFHTCYLIHDQIVGPQPRGTQRGRLDAYDSMTLRRGNLTVEPQKSQILLTRDSNSSKHIGLVTTQFA
jgi:hypothetical protein